MSEQLPQRMRVVRFKGKGQVEVVERPLPEPGPGEALVRIAISAICGSERGAVESGLSEGETCNTGHEMAGIVVRANGTRRAVEGERVGIQVLAGCGRCLYCLQGDPKHCVEKPRFIPNAHGEYVVAPDICLVPLPQDLDWEPAVMLCGDMLGTPYHALKRMGGAHAGETAAIFGCGPIGLGCLTWLVDAGARVFVSEPNAYRRELALKLGADVAIDPTQEDPVARVQAETGGGAELCLDCSPEEQTLQDALNAARVYGRVGWIGEKPSATVNPSQQVLHKGLQITGSWYFGPAEFFEQLAHYRRGMSLEGLITHRFALEDAPAAYRLFASRNAGKIVFRNR